MARVLVLRDREAGAETARHLARRGHQPLVLPLQEIVPTGEPSPDGFFSCVAVTSPNAVPALAKDLEADGIEMLAVGEATAERLRSVGYRVVYVGAGSAEHMVTPAARLAARHGRPVLLALGRRRTDALETGLAAAGVPFAVWETYDTRPLRPGKAAIEAVLGDRGPDAVLLLSVGQAAGYLHLRETDPALWRPPPKLLCLSERIAACLPAELRGTALISSRRDLATLFESLREPSFSISNAFSRPTGKDDAETVRDLST